MKELVERMEARQSLAEASEAECKEKFMEGDHFKGGKGERFDNCVKYMKCKGGVDDPEGMCGKIAREKAKATGESVEDVVFGPEDIELLLTEEQRAQRQKITKAVDRMIQSPQAQRELMKLPGVDMSLLQQTIESALVQLMMMQGVQVSGASKDVKAIRGLGRGQLPTG
jgi:hypothetical protein